MKAGSVFQDLACRIGKHKLFEVQKLSEQAILIECEYCQKRYTLKVSGSLVVKAGKKYYICV